MLICRCAWHTRYFGWPLWNGIASWRGVHLRFTDGICPRCLQRFRTEHHRLLERRRAEAPAVAVVPVAAAEIAIASEPAMSSDAA